jgi:AraC-like DNA-binding protein
LHATYITHAFALHAHEGYAIGVIEAGAETFSYRGGQHGAPAGTVVVVNPGEPHTGQAAAHSGWRYRMLYPAPTLLQRACAGVDERHRAAPTFPAPVIADPALAQLILRTHQALDAATSPLERESRLVWMLTELIKRHAVARPTMPRRGPEQRHVEVVRAYIEAHYAESLLLDELAALVSFSPYHLLRTFRQAVGFPPHAYQTQLRVAQAKRLLAASMPIAEVALQTGFADQSHLSRHFKRLVGVPPGKYAV